MACCKNKLWRWVFQSCREKWEKRRILHKFFYMSCLRCITKLEKLRAWAAPGVIPAGSPPVSLSQQDQTGFHLRNVKFFRLWQRWDGAENRSERSAGKDDAASKPAGIWLRLTQVDQRKTPFFLQLSPSHLKINPKPW